MRRKKSLMAFTLVELLIVIVIIGLLTRALLPRLSNARAKANDTARKAHLIQIGTALSMYQMDKGSYPDGNNQFCYDTNTPEMRNLLKNYISSIPTDPKKFSVDTYGGTYVEGSYVYTHLFKKGINFQGFVLISKVEEASSANRVYNPDGIEIRNNDFEDTNTYESVEEVSQNLCKTVVKSSVVYNGGTGYCTYSGVDQLRYVFLSP